MSSTIWKKEYNKLTLAVSQWGNNEWTDPKTIVLCRTDIPTAGIVSRFQNIRPSPNLEMIAKECFIKAVLRNNFEKMTFLLNFYGNVLRLITVGQLKSVIIKMATKRKIYFATYRRLIEIMGYDTKFHNNLPFENSIISIPFLFGTKKMTLLVLTWLSEINRCVLYKQISPKMLFFDMKTMTFTNHLIKSHNAKMKWRVYKNYALVAKESLELSSIYNR